MSKKTKMSPAKKANRTRQMRRALEKRYGLATADVVMAALGYKDHSAWVRMGKRAAIKANLTRGTYSNIVG